MNIYLKMDLKVWRKTLNVGIKLVCDLQTQVGNEKFLSNFDLVGYDVSLSLGTIPIFPYQFQFRFETLKMKLSTK